MVQAVGYENQHKPQNTNGAYERSKKIPFYVLHPEYVIQLCSHFDYMQ